MIYVCACMYIDHGRLLLSAATTEFIGCCFFLSPFVFNKLARRATEGFIKKTEIKKSIDIMTLDDSIGRRRRRRRTVYNKREKTKKRTLLLLLPYKTYTHTIVYRILLLCSALSLFAASLNTGYARYIWHSTHRPAAAAAADVCTIVSH